MNKHLFAPAPLALAAALACTGTALQAQTLADATPQSVEITGRHYDNAVGSSDAASQGVIRAELLKSRPALRPGEVLEFVPGLIVTQHSGDGKANQYFLRGFNLDHGTDFATTVNGLPVNMPSHGHGQGYSDLNFLIPELVQRVEYRKGPYFARNGDFSSAGSADIVYMNKLDAPFGQLTLGENGYRRGVAGASYELGNGMVLLGAFEGAHNDGPWTVPENMKKSNGVLTLSAGTAAQGWSASLMGYSATWDATDQIPERLIGTTYQGRRFDRFDSLDPTTGGSTERYSLSGEWHRDDAGHRSQVSAYAMRYRLDLNSNFTYALERPETGDQFKQQDARSVYGFAASHSLPHELAGLPARSEVGVQLRHDRIDVGLYDSVARRITNTVREDAVRETLVGVYGQTAVELTPWLRSVAGLRVDQVRNRVDAISLPANGGSSRDTQVSPKLSLIAGPFAALPKTEFFVNAGRGFHSNDARGTTTRTDPKTGDAVDTVPPLVSSKGWELGARTEALPGLQSSIALWALRFDSELVYVGDAGATEASQGSRRRGVEFNNRWTPVPWFLLDADLAWTHARFDNGDRIPNAVDKVASIAATVRELGPWSASIQWRYLGSGALVEDNSQRSKSSLTTNLRVGYQLLRNTALTLDVFNLFDRKVDDIQYYYESQVPGETAAEGRHVHPAEPRSVRLTLAVKF
ncbi:MAG: TonB-dependent receptor [Aquincola sp.]|nr:TonB-dependent receptor [Aquincola sp.]